MIKAFSFLIIGFCALIAIPICFGFIGGLFGLFFGLIGGAFGLVAGIFGAVFGTVAWIFKSIFHLFFGWHWGFHPLHWNGFWLVMIVIIIVAISRRR